MKKIAAAFAALIALWPFAPLLAAVVFINAGGTLSPTWQLGGASGPQLKNNGGVIEACSSTGGATPSIACGITINAANLDAAAGAAGFGSNAFQLGGGSLAKCNNAT